MRRTRLRPNLSVNDKRSGIFVSHLCGSGDAKDWLSEHDEEPTIVGLESFAISKFPTAEPKYGRQANEETLRSSGWLLNSPHRYFRDVHRTSVRGLAIFWIH